MQTNLDPSESISMDDPMWRMPGGNSRRNDCVFQRRGHWWVKHVAEASVQRFTGSIYVYIECSVELAGIKAGWTSLNYK